MRSGGTQTQLCQLRQLSRPHLRTEPPLDDEIGF
jgi:hypothetical protein